MQENANTLCRNFSLSYMISKPDIEKKFGWRAVVERDRLAHTPIYNNSACYIIITAYHTILI